MRSQIAHIFRKDVRRHWREIGLAMAILAAFVWVEPQLWVIQEFRPGIQALAGLVRTLVPLGWAFLIVRLVHEENLVGDRQFWVTRPYEWRKLLAEKLLFILVFVSLPLLIAQVVLLTKAGFKPMSYISGLLCLQLMWILILILPAATLGTITSSIGQAVLVVLGAILCFVGFGILGSAERTSQLARAEFDPRFTTAHRNRRRSGGGGDVAIRATQDGTIPCSAGQRHSGDSLHRAAVNTAPQVD
jgi:hypothetical protein